MSSETQLKESPNLSDSVTMSVHQTPVLSAGNGGASLSLSWLMLLGALIVIAALAIIGLKRMPKKG